MRINWHTSFFTEISIGCEHMLPNSINRAIHHKTSWANPWSCLWVQSHFTICKTSFLVLATIVPHIGNCLSLNSYNPSFYSKTRGTFQRYLEIMILAYIFSLPCLPPPFSTFPAERKSLDEQHPDVTFSFSSSHEDRVNKSGLKN